MRWKRKRADTWWLRDYWVLDLEMGGLDVRTDEIISVGMVPIRDGAIRLGEAYHSHIRPSRRVGEPSLKVHGLLAKDLCDAPDLETVIVEIDRRIRGSAMVVHFAGVDVPFLKAAYERTNTAWPGVEVVDTVQLLLAAGRRWGRNSVRTDLAMARADLGLPEHDHHDALADAVATAEMFLVLTERVPARNLSRPSSS
jgi:DNA polymerase III subunit epsilon